MLSKKVYLDDYKDYSLEELKTVLDEKKKYLKSKEFKKLKKKVKDDKKRGLLIIPDPLDYSNEFDALKQLIKEKKKKVRWIFLIKSRKICLERLVNY